MPEDAPASPERSCFVARPISLTQELATAFYSGDLHHWDHVEEHLILPALRATGYRHIPTPTKGAGLIHAHIIEAINGADLVIADFSRLNPNVFFEAGVRTSVNKPLLVMAEQGTVLPFDLAGINTWFYDLRLHTWDIPRMVQELIEHIESTKTEGNALWTQFGVRLQVEHLVAESPADPTAAILEQISNDLQELRRAQPSANSMLAALSKQGATELDRARMMLELRYELLIEAIVAAGHPEEIVAEVQKLGDTLRTHRHLSEEFWSKRVLAEIERLVVEPAQPDIEVAFDRFCKQYKRHSVVYRTAHP